MTARATVDLAAPIHARPAAAVVKCGRGFRSRVTLTRGDGMARGDSIMQVLLLAAQHGPVTVEADGPDAREAADAVAREAADAVARALADEINGDGGTT